MAQKGARFLISAIALLAITNPHVSHAGFVRKCFLILEGWAHRFTSLNDDEFRQGQTYNIVLNHKVVRVKFLGIDYIEHDEVGVEYLTFQHSRSKEIRRIPRHLISGVVEENYKASHQYTLNAPYKIQTTDGRILNGIFLGEKVSPEKSTPSKIAILNLDTQEVETYFAWEIFHVTHNKNLVKNLKKNPDERADIDTADFHDNDNTLKTTALAHSHNPNYRVDIDPAIYAQMTRAQKEALNRFIDEALERLARFDKNMRKSFPMQRIDDEVTIRFLSPEGGAYTNASKVKIDDRDAYFIRLPIDITRPDLELDVSTVLHERGHHYGHNANISKTSRISLLNDLGYIEGLADYFMAHEMRDPALSRGIPESGGMWYRHLDRREELVNGKIRVIRSPLDAERFGRLEGHALSTFYSYPMWRAFVASQQDTGNFKKITAPDLWSDFHKDMEANHKLYREYRDGFFAGETPLSAESEMLQNIDFFYSYFYKEAYLNPKTPPEKRRYLQAAYKDAKKSFILPWRSIEVTAGKIQSLTERLRSD